MPFFVQRKGSIESDKRNMCTTCLYLGWDGTADIFVEQAHNAFFFQGKGSVKSDNRNMCTTCLYLGTETDKLTSVSNKRV